jgi:dTDP-4-dehydrorhamnose reductase
MRRTRPCQRHAAERGWLAMRLLITGAAGLLGGRLAECLASNFDVVAGCHHATPPAGLSTYRLDLTSPTALRAAISRSRPDAIVHSAAIADADRCERDPEQARRVNVEASQTVARLCARAGLRLVALSTDLVFDGSQAPYGESSTARSSLIYGQTKLAGEEAVIESYPDAAVVRVALVIGRGFGPRATASEAIAWCLAAGQPVSLFCDQHRSPVAADSVADAVARLLAGRQAGRFHLGGAERVSRLELGLRVARVLGLPSDSITPLRQADSPLGASRPPDVSLDSSRARRELDWTPLPLDDAIRSGRRGRTE